MSTLPEPYYDRDGITIYVGDNRDVLPHIGPVHAVCTDPPYDLTQRAKTTYKSAFPGRYKDHKPGGFMGMKWDATGIAFDPVFWEAVEAAMLPGAHLLAFGGTRTYHRMAVAIEDAGLEIRDTLQWLYSTGFPKSHDVSKAIDKMAGALGVQSQGFNTAGGKENYERQDKSYRSDYGYKFTPATPEAEQWQGWGTALKPAYEPIIMARSPFKGTVAQNVLAHGTGAINVDACRIGTEMGGRPYRVGHNGKEVGTLYEGGFGGSHAEGTTTQGRWPANVILDEWMEQVLRLRYNIPNEVNRLIREYYRDYCRVPALPQADTNVSQPQGPDEVLRAGMLRGVAERESQRREAPHARQEAHRGIPREDERTGSQAAQAWPGESPMEGGALSVTGLRDGGTVNAVAGRTGTLWRDGEVQQQACDTGASVSNGADTGSSANERRSSAPQEWQEVGQPTGEPGDNWERRSQANTSKHVEGNQAATGRERSPVVHPLHVLECDIPAGWRQYFELTGVEVRSPDCSAEALDAQSGERKAGTAVRHRSGGNTFGGDNAKPPMPDMGYGDTGGASRFFYVAKASRRERNAGLEGMPERINGRNQSQFDGGAMLTGSGNPRSAGMANHHPTVKPLALMRYLIQMVTPPDGIVLDPFMGSGSTLVAAAELGFPAIGIELSEEYAEIAARRVNHALDERAGYLPGMEVLG